MLKFFNHLSNSLGSFYELKRKEFEYYEEKTAKMFFSASKAKEVLHKGPLIKDEENKERQEKNRQ